MIRITIGDGRFAVTKERKGTLEAKKAIREAVQSNPHAKITVVEVTETPRPDLLPSAAELAEWAAWRAKRDARQKAAADGAALLAAEARLAELEEERANLRLRLGVTT